MKATIIVFLAVFALGLIVLIRFILKLHRRVKPDPNWRDHLGSPPL